MTKGIQLREATLEDADFLFKLKNNPTMRKFAVKSNKLILKRDHIAWLKGNIQTVRIIEWEKQPIGMLRITKDMEVSINLSPEARGKGIGSLVIRNCPSGLWAKIVNGNVPSMKVFTENGFKITGYERNYYILHN